MNYFLAYFHGVFVIIRIDEAHVPVSGKGIPVLLPLFLRTGQVFKKCSGRSPTLRESKEAGASGKGSGISHAALQKRIETIIATILIPHSDEFNHAAQRHQTYDLIYFAFSISRVHLDLVLLRSFSDANFPRTAATSYSTIAIRFRHGERLVLVFRLVTSSFCYCGLVAIFFLCE